MAAPQHPSKGEMNRVVIARARERAGSRREDNVFHQGSVRDRCDPLGRSDANILLISLCPGFVRYCCWGSRVRAAGSLRIT